MTKFPFKQFTIHIFGIMTFLEPSSSINRVFAPPITDQCGQNVYHSVKSALLMNMIKWAPIICIFFTFVLCFVRCIELFHLNNLSKAGNLGNCLQRHLDMLDMKYHVLISIRVIPVISFTVVLSRRFLVAHSQCQEPHLSWRQYQ